MTELVLIAAVLLGAAGGPGLLRRARRLDEGALFQVERAVVIGLGVPAVLLGYFELAASRHWLASTGPVVSTLSAQAVAGSSRRKLEGARRLVLLIHAPACLFALLLGLRVAALDAHARGWFPAGHPRLVHLLAGSAARPALLRELESPEASRRAEALAPLLELDREAAVPRLAAGLRDPDGRVRAAAAEGLHRQRAAPAPLEIVGMLVDPYPRARKVVRESLREDPYQAIAPLLWAVRDGRPFPEHAESALQAAASAYVPNDPAALRRRLGSRWRDLRLEAIRLTGEIGYRAGARSLLVAHADPDPGIRAAALEALGSGELLQELARLAFWRSPATSAAAWKALRELPDAAERLMSRPHLAPRERCPMCRAAERLAEAPGAGT